jgi:agmatinase
MEQTFISAKASFAEANAVILGCPYDGSATFRPGARFGPSAIRKASWGIETYSPYQESDLTQIKIHDMGDLELPLGEKKTSLRLIQEGARRILSAKKFPILLGGDHLITLPMIEEVHRVYPDVHVLHIDAHTDLRDEYLGETLNHSTVMKKVLNLLSKGRLSQVGVRAGTREEFALAEKTRSILFFDPKSLIRMVNRLKQRPVYISLDLDVMDPGLLPGVGTPEPGGFTFQELISLFKGLQPLRIIGFDLVELTPDYDPTQISSVTASVILREMILAFCP